jgi:hypothetical protein
VNGLSSLAKYIDYCLLKKPEDFLCRLDDLICAWDKVVGTDFETLVLLLLGELMDALNESSLNETFRTDGPGQECSSCNAVRIDTPLNWTEKKL